MAGRVTGKSNVAAQVVLMIGILAVINFLSHRHFFRIDFTADKEYTLAPASRDILENLEDIVTVNVYFSRRIPPYLTTLKGRINDMLEEYRAYAGKNLQVEFISPEDDPATQQKMNMLGIPQVQLNILEKDQFQVIQAYMGMTILFEDKKEVIPVIQDTEQLEYQLSSAILKVTRKDSVRVALVQEGRNPQMPGSGQYNALIGEISRQYEYVPFSFSMDRPVPDEVDTLIVAGPSGLDEKALYRLDQFVTRGGKLFLLLNTIDLAGGSLTARRVEHNMGRLLAAWGVEISPEVVADARFNAQASFSSGFMRFTVPYPFWPTVLAEGMDQTQPIVSRLESLVMPWTSPLGVTENPSEGMEYTVLARSSPVSWTEGEPFDFNPNRRIIPRQGSGDGSPLALLLTGAFKSDFQPDELPEGLNEEEAANHFQDGPETSILLVGNARLAQDDFLGQFPENGIFLMNALDWMASGSDLIGIRSRGATDRPLPDLSEKGKALIRYINIFAVAGLVLVIGLVRFYIRRKVAVRGI
jgi:gliding-associated putative ABC transporter substrate-binding component GldG